MINYGMSNGKATIIFLIVELIKKYCYIKWTISLNQILVIRTK